MEGHRARTWQETRLWSELESREDALPALKHAIEGVLEPDVEDILDSGDTMPGNFTLHDSQHSRRVAEWMASLAGETLSELSPYDLAMLLLSAYLHDIGMTPPLGRVKANYILLLTGDSGDMTAEQIDELQAWLDDEWDGLVPPLSQGTPSAEELRLADQIIAGYVRHRHNDWSAQWMREHLAEATKRLYPNFLADLIRLCGSHHLEADELLSPKFEPLRVGSEVLHLRYCACLLRVADVLDFDPERTPPILFAHRDVEGESAIFWHKDHEITLVQEGAHLILEAQPSDALSHHAIELTVEAVDKELAGCRRIADRKSFHRMENREQDLPYRWRLDASLKATIKPRDDAYEYIDGTFRPDTEKLLQLVGGVELYKTPLAALREVLQNAFDAVREQIARERLEHDDLSDDAVAKAIVDTHKVSLALRKSGSELQLICTDSGTGMTSEIIRSRLLVGGKTADHEIRSLERACHEHGFSVGRTARFGIGVLSYFLLASKLEIRTRRSIEAGADGPGWIFTTSGLADFGELKQARDKLAAGTEVVMTIKPELLADGVEEFARDLSGYLHGTLQRAPCPFAFESTPTETEWATGAGWVDQSEVTEARMLAPAFYDQDERHRRRLGTELTPSKEQERRARLEGRLTEMRKSAKEAFRMACHEGELPDGLGSYRIYLGYFELSCGPFVGYMDIEPATNGSYPIAPTPEGDAVVPMGEILAMSWNGMDVMPDLSGEGIGRFMGRTQNTSIFVDWASDAAGRLAANRNTFEPSEAAAEAVDWVWDHAHELLVELVDRHSDSPLALLNASRMRRAPKRLGSPAWLIGGDGASSPARLEPLQPPVVEEAAIWDHAGLLWRGKEVTDARPLVLTNETYGELKLAWHSAKVAPTSIGAADGNGRRPVIVWESIEGQSAAKRPPLDLAEFPPPWHRLTGVATRLSYSDRPLEVWNPAHPLIKVVDQVSWKWTMGTFAVDSLNPLPHRDELLSSPGRVAAWVLRCIAEDEADLWNGLAEHESAFLRDALESIEGLGEPAVVHWFEEKDQLELRVLSIGAWETHNGNAAPRKFAEMFDPPAEDWQLAYADGERELRRKD